MSTNGGVSSNMHPISHAREFTPVSVAASSVRSEEHIDDVGDCSYQQDVLIQPWASPNRLSRQPALPSAHQLASTATNPVVIQPIQNNFTNINGQDVQPQLSKVSHSPTVTSTHFYRNVLPRQSSELPGSSHSTQNASINAQFQRLRTNLPVFGTTSELAAHYGIPRKLPPTPRLNSSNNKPPVPRFDETSTSIDPSTSSNESVSFETLVSSYIDMLSRKPDENTSAPSGSSNVPLQTMEPNVEEAAQSIASLIGTSSPSMLSSDTRQVTHSDDNMIAPEMWHDYLTSPFDDESPFDNFLETPAQGSSDLHDFFTSPVVADLNTMDTSFGDLPLFSQPPSFDNSLELSKMSVSTLPHSALLPTPNFDGLLTMSPATPALDSSYIHSPQVQDVSGASFIPRNKSKMPTGTRKNITPETLVPIDAPTQPRNYLTPSSTSRKEVPAVFARKRARSTAFGDEVDELVEDEAQMHPTMSEADAISAKRRQNTLAARRSRKRKLEYQQGLEEAVENERREKAMWKNRAIMLQSQLQSMGINVPFVDEE